MHDAPARGAAVPDECAAPTMHHLAIRAPPEDPERAYRDFTEAVDADLLWHDPRVGRQLTARLAGPPAEGRVHGVEGAQCRVVVPLCRLVDLTHRCGYLGRRGMLIHDATPLLAKCTACRRTLELDGRLAVGRDVRRVQD